MKLNQANGILSPKEKQTCKRICYLKMDECSPAEKTSGGRNNQIRHLCQIDGNLCTHLVLSSVRNETSGNLALCNSDDLQYLKEVKEFKQKYKHLRVMVAVWINLNELNDLDSRQKFSRSVIDFLQRFHLDGLDLNYHTNQQTNSSIQANPTTTTTTTTIASLANSLNPLLNIGVYRNDYEQRVTLIKLIKCLREAIVENYYDRQVRQANEQLATFTSQALSHIEQPVDNMNNHLVEPYLLTITMQGDNDATTNSGSYNNQELLKQLVNLCDWFNIKSFDYFQFKAYAPFAGPIAPLYPIVDSQFVPILSKLSISSTLSRLLLLTQPESNNNNNNNKNQETTTTTLIPKEKLVLGIPTYARAYKLMFKQTQPTPFNLSVGMMASENGGSGGLLTYKEVCDLLMGKKMATNNSSSENQDEIFVDYYDLRAKIPYLLVDNGYTWISYENTKSVREKVRFIIENQLAGYMTWNLNSDFFFTEESRESNNFPLHRAMYEESLS